MEENSNKEEAVEQKKQEVQEGAKGLFVSIKNFLVELLDFRHDTDHEATVEAIKIDIPFKGATAWILIFAVFIASIGLNADSTAVVIGAMLISPLMGPILGIGMSIAINDIDTMKKSLVNLSTMIVLSLLTAFLFFYIFPLNEQTSELLGRTRPDIRDVLIAFFGGLALMVARTKKKTIGSVIFGVAIATALMPPLCTAGYSLAIGNFSFFFGSMYLFTINTIFIALATFLVLKLLRFPMLKYVNSAKRKRIAQLASVLAFVVMIPAVFTFITVYKESKMNNQIVLFIKNEVKSNPSYSLIEYDKDLNAKKLELNFFNEMTEGEQNSLRIRLNDSDYTALKDFTIDVKGSDTKSYQLITTAYQDARKELQESKNIIAGLQSQIEQLNQAISNLNTRIEQGAIENNNKVIAFSRIAKEAKIRYNDLEQIGFAKVISSKDFIKIDTIPVATISWNKSLTDSIVNLKEIELRTWLQAEMQLDTLFIRRVKD